MLTRDDLIDVILRHLTGAANEPASSAKNQSAIKEKTAHPPMLPRGRVFLTEREIKKRLTPQSEHLTIPKDSIISPLASDWLALQRIKIVRE
jgi:hypothetical protein